IAELARGVSAALATRTGEDGRVGAVPPILPLLPVSRDRDLPLSFAQQRLWFLDQLAPGNPAYNVPWAARLEGELDVALLRRTFATVVRRHEALRTTFAVSPRGPVQEIQPHLAVPLPVVSLERLPKAVRPPELLRLVGAEARLPFDLARGPLLR